MAELTRPEARLTVSRFEAREPVSPSLEDAIRQLEDVLDKYDERFKSQGVPAIRSGSRSELAKQSRFDTVAAVFLVFTLTYFVVTILTGTL